MRAKKFYQRFFIISILYFTVLQRGVGGGVNGFISKKPMIFQGSSGGGGVQHLAVRGPTFPGVVGVQVKIPIIACRTCDFPGVVRTTIPPVDPRMIVNIVL